MVFFLFFVIEAKVDLKISFRANFKVKGVTTMLVAGTWSEDSTYMGLRSSTGLVEVVSDEMVSIKIGFNSLENF